MKTNERWQTVFLIALILVSVSLTKFEKGGEVLPSSPPVASVKQAVAPNLLFERTKLVSQTVPTTGVPLRKWDVLDPKLEVHAALIESLDDGFPFLSYNIEKPWPAASLTKLLSAVVVLEEIGQNKKIPVSRSATLTEGGTGDLKSGEIYAARDLLKIMLLTSSNDAAAAFEEYVGGKNYFVKLLNQKAEKIGMTKTVLHDASGLNDANESTAKDMAKLARYILTKHPDIFAWTRLTTLLVQPINEVTSKTVANINGLSGDKNFLGGKTGTSPEAKQNLVAVFTFRNSRALVVLLGAPDRYGEVYKLFNWITSAYHGNF